MNTKKNTSTKAENAEKKVANVEAPEEGKQEAVATYENDEQSQVPSNQDTDRTANDQDSAVIDDVETTTESDDDQNKAVSDGVSEEPYLVRVITDRTNVQRINLRENASVDAEIDHEVSVGTTLKAVADLGDWTLLKCGLYVMSRFITKL